MSQDSKTIARRFYEEGYGRRDRRVFDDIVAGAVRMHGPYPQFGRGAEGVRAQMDRYLSAFPDLAVSVEDVVGDGDRAVVRWAARGTHCGEFAGIVPSGRHVEFTGMTMFRIRDGRIEELWLELDVLGILQQLGAMPSLIKEEPVLSR